MRRTWGLALRGIFSRVAAATLLALLIGGGVTASQMVEPNPTEVTEDKPMIALSFDDGPSRLTPQILEVLDRHNVKATFFMQGEHVAENPRLARQVAREGHVVANHSYTHPDFTTLSDRQAEREITRTNRVIRNTTGVEPDLFRYPHGHESAAGNAVIRREGMWGGVLWHWDAPLPGDFECPGAEAVTQYIQANSADQAIILLHDGNTVLECDANQLDYLDEVIPRLKAQGYGFGVVAPADAPSPVNQSSWVHVVSH